MSSKRCGWSLKSAAVLATVSLSTLAIPSSTQADSDPWTMAQTVQPADLARELGNSKTAPTVVFVGFKRLYSSGHVKGARIMARPEAKKA
jgi:hypothetical protein